MLDRCYHFPTEKRNFENRLGFATFSDYSKKIYLII